MKTITINLAKENERYLSIHQSQMRIREYLHKLAGNIQNIRRLTGIGMILIICLGSVNAQIIKTNYIGRDINVIKSSMAEFKCFSSNSNTTTDDTYFISFINQYFGTMIFNFKKDICVNYMIKTNESHKTIVLESIKKELPIDMGMNMWSDGVHMAVTELKNGIFTVIVR